MANTLSKVLSILTVVGLLVAVGCGLALRYWGEEFRGAINSHLVLGVASFALGLPTMVSLLLLK